MKVKKDRKSKGFSLLEIMLVLSIAAVLAAIAFLTYKKVDNNYASQKVVNDINFLVSSVRSTYNQKGFVIKSSDYTTLPNAIINDTKNYIKFDGSQYSTKNGNILLMAVSNVNDYSTYFTITYQSGSDKDISETCTKIVSTYMSILKDDESIAINSKSKGSKYIKNGDSVSDFSLYCYDSNSIMMTLEY